MSRRQKFYGRVKEDELVGYLQSVGLDGKDDKEEQETNSQEEGHVQSIYIREEDYEEDQINTFKNNLKEIKGRNQQQCIGPLLAMLVVAAVGFYFLTSQSSLATQSTKHETTGQKQKAGSVIVSEKNSIPQQTVQKQPSIVKNSIPNEGRSFVATCGVRQEGKSFNFTEVKTSEYVEYESRMDSVFKPFNNTNCEYEHFGDKRDGGYLVCQNFLPYSVALVNFGVEGRDQFGCDVTGSFLMPNYQYDCTNSIKPLCGKNKNNNYFNYTCVSDRIEVKGGKNYMSIKDIIDTLGLKQKHITIKIDIEGGEWPGFRSLPIEYLQYIDQIIMEVHNPGRAIYEKAYWGNADIVQSLGEQFVSVNYHMNNWACNNRYYGTRMEDPKAPLINHKINAFAFEVTLVNKNLIKLNSNTRSYALHPKNIGNGAGFQCQMSD